MSQYAIVTDLNRCVGCLGCVVACKVHNGVPVGSYWNKVERHGPFPKFEGAVFPDVYHYFLTMQCQHCQNPPCVEVCPTGASQKLEDGTVQIDAATCIGCQSCIPACPYGVRYLDEETNVVEKCTMCKDKTDKGELPACVALCSGRARFFGDLDEGLGSLRGSGNVPIDGDTSYEAALKTFARLDEVAEPFTDEDVHPRHDMGNGPSVAYILRNGMWQDA